MPGYVWRGKPGLKALNEQIAEDRKADAAQPAARSASPTRTSFTAVPEGKNPVAVEIGRKGGLKGRPGPGGEADPRAAERDRGEGGTGTLGSARPLAGGTGKGDTMTALPAPEAWNTAVAAMKAAARQDRAWWATYGPAAYVLLRRAERRGALVPWSATPSGTGD